MQAFRGAKYRNNRLNLTKTVTKVLQLNINYETLTKEMKL